MADTISGDRGKGLQKRARELEEQFFARQHQELLAKARQKAAERKEREALAVVCGIQDDAVLDVLQALELTSDTVAALGLVPLLEVAWADGVLDDREREAVLKAAVEKGIHEGGPGYEMLEAWLSAPLDPELLEAWKKYVGSLVENMDEASSAQLKGYLLDRAREVAEAAGGFLGLTSKISAKEKEMLEELERAFG
jgi:hypothetical protein